MRDDAPPEGRQPATHIPSESRTRGASRQGLYWAIAIALVAAALVAWYALRPPAGTAPAGGSPAATKGRRFEGPTPVRAATVRAADLPVRLSGLGTVVPRNTVTVRTRVDGQLMRVYFREGATVKAGELLAQIDPRPFEVALAQAQAQQARDLAQLESAKVDLERYRGLLASDSIARQQVDTQQALVHQLEATAAADKAAVENALLQLSYTRIVTPVSGRVGLRQVDAGNLVHAGDANGIVVVTQVEPISVVFPLPQDNVPAVLARLRSGAPLPVDAFDRDGRVRLATGRLVSTDNLVDPATGTVKLKAEFDNKDGALFPNQFVNARLLLETLKDAVVVPTSSIQRGAPGTYVYVVRDDATVAVRPVKLGPADGEVTSIAAGLAPGERVVADGADKLREGAAVTLIEGNSQPGAAPPARPRGEGKGGDRPWRKKREATGDGAKS